MVSMLDEVLNVQTSLQTRGKYNFTTFTSKRKTNEVDEKQVEKSQNNWVKSILPVCVMGGGAVLMYLGVKSPKIGEKLEELYHKRIADMTETLIDFKEVVSKNLDKEYKKVIPYINNSKKEHAFEYIGYTAKIQDSKNGFEVLNTVDEAFSTINGIRAKENQAGGNEIDRFKNYVYQINHPAYQELTNIRKGLTLKLLDLSLMPRFKNGKHNEAIVEMEEMLGKIRVRADEKLFDAQNKITDEHINHVTRLMARQIINTRKNLQSSSETIMEYAYSKIAKLYNLGDDFIPGFKKARELKIFNQLTQENLQPQTLSQNASNIVNNHYLTQILETTDFNKIDQAKTKSLFEGFPSTLDTKQMDLITERIRLQQLVNKSEGHAEDSELQTILGKLEYLTEKMETYGKTRLIEKCGQDFSNLNEQQIHAKLYHINYAARKIGLTGLEDVDKFMLNQGEEYLDSTFKQSLNGILEQPEHYFM